MCMPEKILDHRPNLETSTETPSYAPERRAETKVETTEHSENPQFTKPQKHKNTSVAAHSSATATRQRSIDPEVLGIESILASGLDDFFMHLSPPHQLAFKTEGETAALKIQEALHKPATRIKDIVRLIIDWLKGLPGINKFFLEQEAKIKADTIMRHYRS